MYTRDLDSDQILINYPRVPGWQLGAYWQLIEAPMHARSGRDRILLTIQMSSGTRGSTFLVTDRHPDYTKKSCVRSSAICGPPPPPSQCDRCDVQERTINSPLPELCSLELCMQAHMEWRPLITPERAGGPQHIFMCQASVDVVHYENA